MQFILMILFFIVGIIFGSFYNVVGYRVPKGESILYPSSHCTKCKHELKPYELVPIFSFLFLKGKCKKCGTKISWFYPIFEFLTGILFMLSYLIFTIKVCNCSPLDNNKLVKSISRLLIIFFDSLVTIFISYPSFEYK